ncbi:MAG: glycosyltransferase family 4 protein [Candidatus Magasanikbacteria bacterium]|nr:glycosyltransferase family 4 protein [Candidatus Magasanikbacteria bacterium]
MRIGIDARFLGSDGGIARYVKRLAENLECIDHENEYIIFLRRKNWNEYNPSNPRFSKQLADIPWYGIKEQLLMPFVIRRARVDLMHFPHWNMPLLYRGPFVVTIHDIILLRFPSKRATTRSHSTYLFKHLCYRAVLNHAVSAAKHILAPSEFTKNDVARALSISPKKITVTYEGVDAPNAPTSPEHARSVLNTFGIHEPYVLYIGVAYPHKNLEWLIEAISAYNTTHGARFQTVLSGRHNYFYERIKHRYAKHIRNNQLILTDFVPDDTISELFKNASAYISPSLYEGFGLPPLQACAYGTPVLSSNTTSMPEILGNAALYFDPTNVKDFCAKLFTILNDEKTRKEYIQNGLIRYQQFSWKKMAEMSLLVYKSAFGGNP